MLVWQRQNNPGALYQWCYSSLTVRSTTSTQNKLAIVPAREEDVDLVIEILDKAAEWLESIRFPTRWHREHLPREKFLAQIRSGEVFLAKLGLETVGTITLQWSDPVFWDKAPQEAAYIHKFAVSRAHVGQRIDESMLAWAQNQASRAGKKHLRLDCLANNKIIREYYEKAGFIHRGDTSPLGWLASLYEKRL